MSIVFSLYVVSAMAANYDYADATGYNNTGVYAQNATWNRLGTTWTGEASAAAVAGNIDTDDGVLWSINGGAYGNAAITAGDTVKFEFTLSKVQYGRHAADYLRVWIDWNNDYDFTDSGEMVLTAMYDFPEHPEADGSSTQFLNAGHTPEIVATYEYTKTFNDVIAGEYWLRARVVCSRDLGGGDIGFGDISKLTPTAGFAQGEIEDWKLTVNNKVPEPASLLLFGLGLMGLAGIRRKMKK